MHRHFGLTQYQAKRKGIIGRRLKNMAVPLMKIYVRHL